ncbi:MAG: pilus assembly protein PilY [Moraxellaceae bacterium]|jgi:type IV pilus assembly protein PilY1|nr:pilus assembly protein PilY [Moraxellaceae bacterium]
MDENKKHSPGNRLLAALAAFVISGWTLAPAYASDTEVYAREVDFSADTTPVLMMVLDSSGSMNDCLENCPNGLTRIGALRNAMRKVLFGDPTPTGTDPVVKPAPDFIKMGYTRFNPDANDGGWTRYPALRLSETVPDKWTEQSTIDVPVRSDADDVSGTTLVNGDTYAVGTTMSSLGLRYIDLQIPRNATITGAMLLFTSDGTGSIPRSLDVAVDNVGNSAALTATGTGDRATWTANTSPDTDTSPNPFWVDVKSLVQTVVNRADWCGGNALTLRVNNNGGSRTTQVWSATYANAQKLPELAPRLIVSYEIKGAARASSCISAPLDYVVGVKNSLDDIEWPDGGGSNSVEYSQSSIYPAAIPDGVRQMAAIRFPKVPVPANATIDKAWLYLTSSKTDTTAASIRVSAFDTSNVPEFCTVDAVTKRVSCTVPAYSPTVSATLALPASAAGSGTDGVHRVVNVTAPVSAVVSRIGWQAENAIGFLLHANDPNSASSNSSLHTADSAVSKAAFLHVVARKTFTDLDKLDKTARQDLFDDVNVRMYASGGTPLGDAYVEAARYMLGMSPYSVDTFTSTFDDQAPSQTYYQPDPRTADAITGKYVAPLENISECSANYIYLMSDGEPNNASNVNNNSNAVTSGYNASCNAYSGVPLTSGNAKANFACMLSIAKHLSSGTNQKKAVIRTNTVLFDDALTGAVVTDMERVSKDAYGKGEFFHAKTSSQLTDSLLKTMTRLIDTDGSITAPGVAVNQFNRLNHLDQLYYAVFKPEAKRARWLGNVKRYRLRFEETVLNDGTKVSDSTIVDADNKNAIDPATTFFAPGSRSFWRDLADGADGADVATGGAAGKIPHPSLRSIYTYLPAYSSSTMSLSNLDSVTTADGMTVTGLASANQFSNVRNWLKGYRIDIKTSAGDAIRTDLVPVSASTLVRGELGGVLHSQPVLVNFGYTSATAQEAATDASKQDNMVFFSTQEGMLHAVDANSGVEKFAFMPKETLARIDELVVNGSQDLPEFGLDSSWTVLRIDGNKDGKITTDSTAGDKVWLFGGMRMGGRNYYALDVTNRNSPKLKWVKRGGLDTGFLKMGQTWSKPVLGDVKIGTTVKTVLFFAGGYDTKHESAGYTSANASDTLGNQLYIVDPDSGDLLWSASSSGADLNDAAMKFSIPTEPKLFDANKDGLVDAVYFGDLGGQVFRVDIKNGNSASTLGHRIKRLAAVGQTVEQNTINQRRFYEPPSVAMLLDPATNMPYVVVAMGTGYRSHPLDLDTDDFFYVFKDDDVLRGDLLTVASSELQPLITPSLLAELNLASPSGVDLTAKMGWMVDLPQDGEKVLGAPIILFGEVIFSTYVPQQNLSTSKCSPVIGASNTWYMSVRDGAASRDNDKDGDIDDDDRTSANVVQGLGGPPQVVVGDDGRNVIITGTGVERNTDLDSANMRRTRWYQKSSQ